MNRFALILSLLLPSVLCAQNGAPDSTRRLDEVVVTATRNERSLGLLPLPVTLISKAQIRTMGSLRLNDVLNEQTGLVSVPQVNGSGNGLQLQGFDPDYTLILIDGEPLVGRTTGSLDLGRITVGNIKQIEIVKGPSSSLYGSDALAGVVNIITERPSGTRGSIYSRYGTNQTLDVSGDFGTQQKKLGLYLFGNRYSTQGYDLTPDSYGKTVNPHQSFTLHSKLYYKFAPSTDFSISGRYFQENQQSEFEVDSILSAGRGKVTDWNINPVLIYRVANKAKVTLRYYTTRYQTRSELHHETDGSSISSDDFTQTFQRPEVKAEFFLTGKNILTAGAGMVHETVQTNRYGDENDRVQDTRYVFLQEEWDPNRRFSLITGGRYDHNTIYGGQLSPKISSRYELSSKLTLKGSVGVGFKSPDFRQLYLNFTNAAAGGYSVFGTEVAKEQLAIMDFQGRIAAYLFDPSQIGKLKAERSASYNLGIGYTPASRLVINANLFRNDVDGLIETQVVAVTTTGQSIYSYRNLNHVYMQGLESDFSYSLVRHFTFSLGYQLLFAKDKDKVAAIRRGEVFRRDPATLESFVLKPGEYFGLYNRSRHMANFKVFYENKQKGYTASARIIYRGRFGISSNFGNTQGSDSFNSGNNGNDVLDTYDQFVKGYALVNLSAAKVITGSLRVQLGIDNLFNHTQANAIPNLPGRLYYATVSYALSKQVTN